MVPRWSRAMRSASGPSAAASTAYPSVSRILRVSRRTGSWSSTTRIVSAPPRVAAARAGPGASASTVASTRGRYTLKTVPRPDSLSSETYPSLCLTMPYTVDSPEARSLCPVSLVVKNGSKMWARVVGVHPESGVAHRQHDVGAWGRDLVRRVPGADLDIRRLDRRASRRRAWHRRH